MKHKITPILTAFLSAALLSSCTLASSFSPKDDAPRITSLKFSQQTLTLAPGAMEILTLTLGGLDKKQQKEQSLVWHFDGEIIAAQTDNFSAVLTGLKQGNTTLRVEAGGLSASCAVTVSGEPKKHFSLNPYVYSDVEFLSLEPGEEKRVTASLYGEAHFNKDAFSFTSDKPSLVQLSQAGNYCLVRGEEEGLARVTISHKDASFSYSFLVAVERGEGKIPFLTSSSPVLLLNRSLEGEAEKNIKVTLHNPPSPSWAAELSVKVRGEAVAAEQAGDDCLVRALKPGDAEIDISHPSAPYPLSLFIRVTEALDPVYIAPSTPVLRLRGNKTEVLSAQLINLPPGEQGGDTDFTWSFSQAAEEYLEWEIFDNQITLAGRKSGACKVSIGHPRAETKAEAAILISDIAEEAARASTSIGVNKHFLELEAGGEAAGVSVFITNAKPGEEERLTWTIASFPDAPSPVPVVKYREGTGRAVFKSLRKNTREGFTMQGSPQDMAHGYALFEGLRPGRAEIVITHPLALYPVKILVSVPHPASSAALNPLRASRKRNVREVKTPTPYLTTSRNVVILNPKSGVDNISIQPLFISAHDYGGFLWENSAPDSVKLTPQGKNAGLTALREEGEALITVSHPLAANSLEIYVSIGERYSYKNKDIFYISTDKNLIELETGGEEDIFHALLCREGSRNGENETQGFHFSINPPEVASLVSSPFNAACVVRPLTLGKALISIRHDKADFEKQVLVMVKAPETEQGAGGSLPYLSAREKILTLNPGSNASLTARLHNFSSPLAPEDWDWSSDTPAVADIITEGGSAAMLHAYASGRALITVKCEKASPAPLRILVIVEEEKQENRTEQEYIKTSAQIINLCVDDTFAVSASLATQTRDKNALPPRFSWSLSDSRIALLDTADDAALVQGLKPGVTYLTVTSSALPELYSKRIIVNVKERPQEDCYISVNQKIITMKNNLSENFVLEASLVNGAALDAQDFVFWVDDASLVHLTALADRAHIAPLGAEGGTTVHVMHPKAADVVDILVMLKSSQEFAFSTPAKTIEAGKFCFIPLITPVLPDGARIEYHSSQETVVSAAGTNKVVMLAGLNPGIAEIRARVVNRGKILKEALLAVIVEEKKQDKTEIRTQQTVIQLGKDSSLLIPASLQGPLVQPEDRHALQWRSSDEKVVSLRTTEGDSAFITAENTGEVVLTLTHPRYPEAELNIHIIVPEEAARSLLLDFTELNIEKDDGPATLTATITNGREKDYRSIQWSAARTNGQNIVTLSKTSGKQCVLIPRTAGSTLVTAQLNDKRRGELLTAQCLVIVKESAELYFETQLVEVNPGYSKRVALTILPQGLVPTWVAYTAEKDTDASALFSYAVNEKEGYVEITGLSKGRASLSGYFTSSSGSAAATLDINVAYSYSFELEKGNITIEAEPVEDALLEIPFSIFPYDLEVEAALSSEQEDKLSLLALTIDRATGRGKAVYKPLWEEPEFEITLTAHPHEENLNDEVRPMTRVQKARVCYKELNPVIKAKTRTGAFSTLKNNTLELGDGEEMLLFLEFDKPKSAPSDPRLTWQVKPGAAIVQDNTLKSQSTPSGKPGLITLSSEARNTDANNSAKEDYWLLKHEKDYKEGAAYYITHDMSYDIYDYNNEWVENVGTYDGKGISAWRTESWASGVNSEKLSAQSTKEALSAAFSFGEDKIMSISWGVEIPGGAPSGSIPTSASLSILPSLGSGKGFFNSLARPDSYTGEDGAEIKYGFSGTVVTAENVLSHIYTTGIIHGVRTSPSRGFLKTGVYSGSVKIKYTERKTLQKKSLVVSEEAFRSNPNWYRPLLRLNRTNLAEMYFHKRAYRIDAVDDSPEPSQDSIIIVSWKGADGKSYEKKINVEVKRRNCPAYSSGKWKAVAGKPGQWEEN